MSQVVLTIQEAFAAASVFGSTRLTMTRSLPIALNSRTVPRSQSSLES